MTNLDRLLDRLKVGKISPDFREELEFQMFGVFRQLDDGETYDLVDAFFDSHGFKAEKRQILIDVGYYRPISEEEIARYVCSSGHPWSFSKRGVKYIAVEPMSLWLFR